MGHWKEVLNLFCNGDVNSPYAKNQTVLNAVPSCVFWIIWLKRNNRCSNDRRDSISLVKSICLKSLYLWGRNNIVSDFDSLIDSLIFFNLYKDAPFSDVIFQYLVGTSVIK